MEWALIGFAILFGAGLALPAILQAIMAYQDAKDRRNSPPWN